MAGALDGAVKTTELAWVRAKQLIDRITVMRYQMFTRNLLERRDSPVLPGVWRDVGNRFEMVYNRFKYYGSDWLTWASLKKRELTILFAVMLCASLGLSCFVRHTVAASTRRPPKPPSFFERAMKDAW